MILHSYPGNNLVIFKAIESILKVKTVDMSGIRLMMDDLLKNWEGR